MTIRTRYIPATEEAGPQVIARAPNIPAVLHPYDERLDSLGNHLAAARIVANRINYRLGGASRQGGGFVFTAYRERVLV